ncbi:hypothetical protein BD779DRAFT_1565895 [Infundibulicybe gibba]|nr:hypothetical protein BD779DRAFT_1565895 [Infundibulicybe gibba]
MTMGSAFFLELRAKERAPNTSSVVCWVIREATNGHGRRKRFGRFAIPRHGLVHGTKDANGLHGDAEAETGVADLFGPNGGRECKEWVKEVQNGLGDGGGAGLWPTDASLVDVHQIDGIILHLHTIPPVLTATRPARPCNNLSSCSYATESSVVGLNSV